MQTFLPFASFEESARVLDGARLSNQRNEGIVILKSNLGLYPSGGWSKHPAAKMWKGYEGALCKYIEAVCRECLKRGYKDTTLAKLDELRPDEVVMPHWFGDEAFHAAHRSQLLRKAPDWYASFGWQELSGLDYVWPTGRESEALETVDAAGCQSLTGMGGELNSNVIECDGRNYEDAKNNVMKQLDYMADLGVLPWVHLRKLLGDQ
jgi:hypothetical protein